MSFNERWEKDIYAEGLQLNHYPHHTVVSHVMRFGAGSPDKSLIKVLDIGCGAGNNLVFIASAGFQAFGIDGSASAVAFAKRRLEREHLSADARVGDFANLPWPDNFFDLVIDRCALSHNRRATIEATLDEIKRTLKPCGELYSELWSDAHFEKNYGTPLGDGSCEVFSEGTFKPIGTTFFASLRDIDDLFASRFTITTKNHMTCEHMIEQRTSASWAVTCRKPVED
ncbi:class I SAM-dependent methyltransferase [Magnetovibrio sp.]|uniref:class I SAM-dependent methyltransferase n=1 Tax=Magnetovibrio sp. TaxID=2024836 RepID=UPI002F94C50F